MSRQRIKAGLQRAVAPDVKLGPTEDRQRDRAEGAKAAGERCGYLDGCQVARDWNWHGAAHLKRAWVIASTAIFAFVAELLCVGPGRGDFLVSNFHPGAIPGSLVGNDFWQ